MVCDIRSRGQRKLLTVKEVAIMADEADLGMA
jgi:hypothetical protein